MNTNLKEKEIEEFCLEQNLYHLEFLLHADYQSSRKKIAKTRIQSLHALYMQEKHCKKRGWKGCFFSRSLLANMASSGISVRSFNSFTNSEAFKLFGSKEDRFRENGSQTTNSYKLHSWVFDLFETFERLGFMHGFKTDFNKWMKVFKKRLHGAFIPLLQAGKTLKEIISILCKRKKKPKPVIDSLSTENDLKLHGGTSLNCTPLLHAKAASSYDSSNEGSKNNSVQAKSLFLKKWQEIEEVLTQDYRLQGSDLYNAMRFIPLIDLERGLKLRKGMWTGTKPRSQIAALRHCVEKAKGKLVSCLQKA